MERYSMFLGRKNQYCDNDYITKCNLQSQCDPYQITNGIFHRTRKNFIIYMETQKTPNSQSSLEKKEWSWRNQPSWFQTIIQSYSHQDNMVLAQKQKHKPMEQDRVQFSSVTQSCLTLCDPMDCSTPGLPVHHQLPEFNQTHVHWVGDAIQPSHPVVPFSSCPQSFPDSGSFQMSQLFASGGQVLEFQLQHQSFQWTPRTDLL